MDDLGIQVNEASDARYRIIVTDGVFSMDGYMAPLPEICPLAAAYDCLVMTDDSHAVGFVGANGRGTHEHFDVMGRIDAITGTLGNALGGASGGYGPGRRRLGARQRQRLRRHQLVDRDAAPRA